MTAMIAASVMVALGGGCVQQHLQLKTQDFQTALCRFQSKAKAHNKLHLLKKYVLKTARVLK